MKKNTRDYPKRQNFEEGGEAISVKVGGERLDPNTGDAISQQPSAESQAGGGATWATKAQKAKAAWRIAHGYVP